MKEEVIIQKLDNDNPKTLTDHLIQIEKDGGYDEFKKRFDKLWEEKFQKKETKEINDSGSEIPF